MASTITKTDHPLGLWGTPSENGQLQMTSAPDKTEKGPIDNTTLSLQLSDEQEDLLTTFGECYFKIGCVLGELRGQKTLEEMSCTSLEEQIKQLKIHQFSELNANINTFELKIAEILKIATSFFDECENTFNQFNQKHNTLDQNQNRLSYFPKIDTASTNAFEDAIASISIDMLKTYPEYIKSETLPTEVISASPSEFDADIAFVNNFFEKTPQFRNKNFQAFESIQKEIKALRDRRINLADKYQRITTFHADSDKIFKTQEKQKISQALLQLIKIIYQSIDFSVSVSPLEFLSKDMDPFWKNTLISDYLAGGAMTRRIFRCNPVFIALPIEAEKARVFYQKRLDFVKETLKSLETRIKSLI